MDYSSKKKVISHQKKTKSKANEKSWEEAIKSSSSTLLDYSPKAKFTKGDLINHPKFGKGVIEKLIDKNKIEVLFKDDTKTLMHNI